jgi:Mn-dependent DtxR family transcriptional regulator
MLRENLTQSIEDYLKAIYELTLHQGRASTNQIAQRMGVTPASVTGMLKRLAANDPPLLDYHKHRGVALTAEGERVALELIRHHRLLELYLHERLGYAWDEVHEEADRLEHVISENFDDPQLLRYLYSIGLIPQAHLHVVEYSGFDGNLYLDIAGEDDLVVLGPRVTRQIYVEVE